MTDLTVANTILAQLGGRRFVAMTGASSLAGGDTMLSFRLPAGMVKGRASAMRIRLEPTDTYLVELLKMKAFECVVTDRREDVHAEDLARVFTDMTGLDTVLAPAA